MIFNHFYTCRLSTYYFTPDIPERLIRAQLETSDYIGSNNTNNLN